MICGLPLVDGRTFKDPVKEIVKAVIDKRRGLKDHKVDKTLEDTSN
jgi:hypothetical protein